MSNYLYSQTQLNDFMGAALEEAVFAAEQGEVPIGSVIVQAGAVLSRAHNQVESKNDATCHAELTALQLASASLGRWRLEDCALFVTLEPCAMCLGAIRLARIPLLVFGAGESRMGALTKLPSLITDSTLGPACAVISGVRESECSELLRKFFQAKRQA